MIEVKLSFEQYFSKYYQQAFKYTITKVFNPETAEDITMDAFVSCYQNFDNFDISKASFATWLYVVLNNKIKNYYRDKKTTEPIDDHTELSDSFENDIVEAIHLAEMKKILEKSLLMLDAQEQELIRLKYFDGEKSTSISTITGLSPGNVRVHLHRAIKKLKKYFEENNVKWEF